MYRGKLQLLSGLAAIAVATQDGGAAAEKLQKREALLQWRGAAKVEGYRHIDRIFSTHIVRRGAKVRPLPVAAAAIRPAYRYGAESGSADDYMARNRTAGLLVIHKGRIVLEKYALGITPQDRWISFSIAKSLTSTLLGAAIADGKIAGIDAPVTRYIPELKGSAYDGVTIRQVLTMRSGVAWNEDYADPDSDVGRLAASMAHDSGTSLIATMQKLPRAAPPGTRWHYSTGESNMIGIIVTRAVGEPLADYLSRKIWRRYGMESDASWVTDGGVEIGGCCLNVTLRDYGRIGLFAMGGGMVEGKPILPRGWMAQATSAYTDHAEGDLGYGYQWWVPSPGTFAAIGIMGQYIYVDPRRETVIAEISAWPNAGDDEHHARQAAFRAAVIRALPAAVTSRRRPRHR